MTTFTRSSWKNKWAIILYSVIISAALFYGSLINLSGLESLQNGVIDFSKIEDLELAAVFARFVDLTPSTEELAHLAGLEVQSSRRPIMCQIGFNPFIAYYQLFLNPNSVVYSFHRTKSEDEERAIYNMAAALPHAVPILGNPLHTIRSFVREFSVNGAGIKRKISMWDEYSEFSYSGNARNKIRDLFIDEKNGVTCDIVYRSGGDKLQLSMLALLSRRSTEVIYKDTANEEDASFAWQEIISPKDGVCNLNNHVHCGHFMYSDGVELKDAAVSATLRAYRESLKKALAVANSSKIVVWIPVGSAHQFFADSLFCSLKKLNVTNYVFFSHDAEMHHYLIKKGRNSFFDDQLYTSMQGRQGYHSSNFNAVMRERFSITLDMLELGYSVLINDADSLWLQDLMPSLLDQQADVVAQMDQPTEKYYEVCTGFAFYKNRPATWSLMHKLQQLAFYFPRLDDQELSNLLFKSKQCCLIWHDKNISSCNAKPAVSLTVQLHNPALFVSGHLFCNRHNDWVNSQVRPSFIHLNGARSKETCMQLSEDWGYNFEGDCT